MTARLTHLAAQLSALSTEMDLSLDIVATPGLPVRIRVYERDEMIEEPVVPGAEVTVFRNAAHTSARVIPF